MDGAGTAVPGLTTHMGAGQVEVLADEMDEECSGLDIGRYLLPVDCHRDIHKEVPFVENLM
jgi:hypothetical protein